MSQEAVSQDLMSILRMFSSPRMGPFENTNAPAPQPPPAGVANAGPGVTSSNEQQSDAAPSAGPPQPVARRVLPEGGAADAPAAGANESKLTLPPPGSGAPGPGLAAQPPVAPGAGTMPDFVSSNPVWQAWEAQRQRLYAEAIERQKTDLMAAGIGDIAGAFGAKVGGYRGGGEGGGITTPGGSLATGSSALTMDQFSAFKKAQDDAAAEKADLQRIDRIVADPRMKGVSKDVLLSLRANHKEAFTKIIGDYFSGETDTKVDPSTGAIVSRPKFGQPDAGYSTVYRSPETEAKAALERAKTGQELINPALQSDDVLKQVARATNQPHPDDPRTLAMLRSMSPQKLQEMISSTATAAAGVAQPREWEGKEIEEKRQGRLKINESVAALPRLEYLVGQIDEGMRSGSWVGDRINDFNRNIGNFIGVERGTRNADEYNAAVQTEVQKVIKTYGANASDRDAKAAEASFGQGLGPESARVQLGFVAKTKVWEVAKHNADIQSRLDRGIMTDQNGRSLEAQKADYPKPTDAVIHTMNIAPENVEMLKAHKDDPNARMAFRQLYGENMAEWVLGELK